MYAGTGNDTITFTDSTHAKLAASTIDGGDGNGDVLVLAANASDYVDADFAKVTEL